MSVRRSDGSASETECVCIRIKHCYRYSGVYALARVRSAASRQRELAGWTGCELSRGPQLAGVTYTHWPLVRACACVMTIAIYRYRERKSEEMREASPSSSSTRATGLRPDREEKLGLVGTYAVRQMCAERKCSCECIYTRAHTQLGDLSRAIGDMRACSADKNGFNYVAVIDGRGAARLPPGFIYSGRSITRAD